MGANNIFLRSLTDINAARFHEQQNWGSELSK